jgi:hypothetical protein
LADLTPQWPDAAPEREAHVQELLASLAHESLDERRRALHAFAPSPSTDERVIAAIVELLRCQDPGLREEATMTLAGIGRPAVGALLAGLSSDDGDFRKAIVITLGVMGPQARPAVAMLRVLAEEEAVGIWARRALVRVEGRSWESLARLWLGAAGLALVLMVACSLLLQLGASARLPRPAVTAGLISGGLGAVMGLLVSRQARREEAALMSLIFGAGGAFAGGLLAWLIAALIAPVVKALGG